MTTSPSLRIDNNPFRAINIHQPRLLWSPNVHKRFQEKCYYFLLRLKNPTGNIVGAVGQFLLADDFHLEELGLEGLRFDVVFVEDVLECLAEGRRVDLVGGAIPLASAVQHHRLGVRLLRVGLSIRVRDRHQRHAGLLADELRAGHVRH